MATRFAPGLRYWLGNQLYVGVTNRCNATSLVALRGPGFALPADSGFEHLQEEPSAEELFAAVDDAYEHDPRKVVTGMGEDDVGVVMAGFGEPLLRLDVVAAATALIKERRHGVPVRLKTNGLVPSDAHSNQQAAAMLAEAGVGKATVLLPCADPASFDKAMAPTSPELNFGSVCDFISELVQHGVAVECTTIKKKGVDVTAVRQLAHALGALETRVLPYYE